MIDTKPLWAYMEIDMKIEAAEGKLKKSKAYTLALKLRNTVKASRDAMAKADAEVPALRDEIAQLEKQALTLAAEAQSTQFTAEQTMTAEQIKPKLDALQEVLQRMDIIDKQIVALIDRVSKQEKSLAENAANEPKWVKGFEDARAAFEKEKAEATPAIDAHKAKLTELESAVDAALLARYKTIRQTKVPPMAKLLGDQCGGCSMSVPSTVVRAVKAGNKIVECENCGRIISQ